MVRQLNTERFSDAQSFPSTGHGGHNIKVAERRAFVEWISSPPELRDPKTLKAWCAQNNINPTTAQRWRRDTRVYEEAADRLGRHIDLEVIPGVIGNMADLAANRKSGTAVAAAKVLIDYLKWHVARTQDDVTDVSKLSDDQLRELMLEALDEYDVRTPLPKT